MKTIPAACYSNNVKNGLGIAVGLFAWIISGAGIAFYFVDSVYQDRYLSWTLFGIWISENIFIFGKSQCQKTVRIQFSAVWINSMVATCRVGCWCCIDDNIIEPLTVVDEEIQPEGQIKSERIIMDPYAQPQVVKIAEPEAVFTVDSTAA